MKGIMVMAGHEYQMEMKFIPHFSWAWDNEAKSLALVWARQTQISNFIWMYLVSLKWRWPPIRVVCGYTNIDDIKGGVQNEAKTS